MNVRLPDLEEIPEIGSRQRCKDEALALTYARQVLIEEEGDIRSALARVEQKLRGPHHRRYTVVHSYAALLTQHVEQCWAGAILR